MRTCEIAEQLQSVTVDSPLFLELLAPVLLSLHDHDAAAQAMAMATAVAHHDPWVRASGHAFRARSAENGGDVAAVRADCAAAVAGVRGRGVTAGYEDVGDRWGPAGVLPLQAVVLLYDGDLDSAEKALVQSQEMRREFHSVSSEDELFPTAPPRRYRRPPG